MLELLILFAQFWCALFVVGLAGMLLAKIHLLPAVLYVMIVKTVAPAWVEAEHTKYLLILAALIRRSGRRGAICWLPPGPCTRSRRMGSISPSTMMIELETQEGRAIGSPLLFGC